MDDNQKKGVTKTLLGLAAFIALVLGLLVASIILPRGLTEEQARALGYYRFDTPRAIPAFSLTDHHGNQVGLDKLQGQPSMLFFGFTTCPDICPTTLSVLAESVKGVAEHPQIIMVSVDPERDTPEKLSAYVPAFNPDFTGYTGSFDETVKLATALNIAFGKVPGQTPGTYTVDHSANLVLVNQAGQYTGFVKAPHNAASLRKIYASLLQ